MKNIPGAVTVGYRAIAYTSRYSAGRTVGRGDISRGVTVGYRAVQHHSRYAAGILAAIDPGGGDLYSDITGGTAVDPTE